LRPVCSHHSTHRASLWKREWCFDAARQAWFHLRLVDGIPIEWIDTGNPEGGRDRFQSEGFDEGSAKDIGKVSFVDRSFMKALECVDGLFPAILHSGKADHVKALEGVSAMRRISENDDVVGASIF
jgi:hypothetical protein